jgi:hypothetical protein
MTQDFNLYQHWRENLKCHSVVDDLASLHCLTCCFVNSFLWIWFFVVFSYKNMLEALLKLTTVCKTHKYLAVIVKYVYCYVKFFMYSKSVAERNETKKEKL